jgi:hypothetical protein
VLDVDRTNEYNIKIHSDESWPLISSAERRGKSKTKRNVATEAL